ncbi:MAG: hypothetical protein K1X81_00225 [Bacteroidia bacterium]|nr:hypothetical protein [Bacteroidia bacterium]
MEIRKKAIHIDGWLWCTLTGSLAFLAAFFWPLLTNPGHVFYNTGGDGFQTYFTALFHIKFDSSYGTQQAMNYPFRESIFFTGCEPLYSIPLKLLSPYVETDSTLIALTNLAPLLSIVLCTLFLYLILRSLTIPGLWSCVFAIGISYLSPQVIRLQGHYSLTYQFALPFFIYQFIRFHKKASTTVSIQTGAAVFLLGIVHLYFVAFFLFLLAGYWVWQIAQQGRQQFRFAFFHVVIQGILPVAALLLLMNWLNTASDRTAMPWGMMAYKSTLSGMFYPYARPYEFMVKTFFEPELTEWEGLAYAGIFGILTSLALLSGKIRQLVQNFKRPSQHLAVTGNALLDTFLWTAVAVAMYGCGRILFINTEKVMDYLGPLKQLRGIGRFTWLFFYIINITGVYFFYHLLQNRTKPVRILVMGLLAVAVYTDAIANVRLINQTLNNRLPSLDDHSNQLPENNWINLITPSAFQAILPLPFFQVGAENFGTGMQHHQVVLTTELIVLKTGLPMVSMTSSRSSLKESWLNFQYALENYRPLQVLQWYPNKKPLLVLAWPDKIPPAQKNLFLKCKKIFESPGGYGVYELPYDSLLFDSNRIYRQQESMIQTIPSYPFHGESGLSVSDTGGNLTYFSFDNEQGKENGYFSKGCKKIKSKKFQLLLSKKLHLPAEERFNCSFWIKDISADLKGRIFILFVTKNIKGETVQYNQFYAPGNIVAADAEWGLIEFPITFKPEETNLEIYVHNDDLPSGSYYCIDEFLLKPENCHVLKKDTAFLMHNNRYFPVHFLNAQTTTNPF